MTVDHPPCEKCGVWAPGIGCACDGEFELQKLSDLDELQAFRAREDRLQRDAHAYACTQHPSILESIAETLKRDPTEGNDGFALAAEYRGNMRQLEDFREREPLVQRLLESFARTKSWPADEALSAVSDELEALRDFVSR